MHTPYFYTQALDAFPIKRAIVFAPHPDDEVFGCGGALRLLMQAGVAVRAIIATDGGHTPPSNLTRMEYIDLRQRESEQAAAILGGYTLTFWGHQDRELRYGERLVRDCLLAIQEWQADMVFAPSHFEVHPDHRALAMSVLEAVRRHGACRLALYEVGQPLPYPNILLDIGSVQADKRAAMQCFASQLAQQNYLGQIEALNRYRAYHTPGAQAVEAFFLLTPEDLAGPDPIGLFRSEHASQAALGMLADEAAAPLVSIIVRSMDRATLDDALDSIALQTYPNIEVVLVNAKGKGHRSVGEWCGRYPLRIVNPQGEALSRSAAANAGLAAARGNWIGFLDDDDLLLADHVAKLARALSGERARVAYSGVRAETPGQQQIVFDEEWSLLRLLGGNFIPLHAVLFDRSLLDAGCCFDETLECLEDWDFWLQLAQHSAFVHVPGVSAVYRMHLGESGLSQRFSESLHHENRARLYAKWLPRVPDASWGEAFYWYLNERNHLQGQLRQAQEVLRQRESAYQEALRQRESAYQAESHALLTQLQKAESEAVELRQQIQGILQSTSWRLTAPLRQLVDLMRKKL